MAKTTTKQKKTAPVSVGKTVTRTTRKIAKAVIAKATPKPAAKAPTSAASRRATPVVKTRIRPAARVSRADRSAVLMTRAPQFTYMKAPGIKSAYEVGDTVEVYCDHERNSERVRGWLKGTVVQVDNKMVAVQFRSNVFLTDGWMVPDRILWYSVTSDQIHQASAGKKGNRKQIPDY